MLLLTANMALGQIKKLMVNNNEFIIKIKKQKNEWNTYDKVKELYRVEKGKKIYLLKYYEYKDGGGDCNNIYWNEEKMEVKNDSLIFLTHYLQNLNDPIPQWRKQIYQVNKKGKLILVYDKYRY